MKTSFFKWKPDLDGAAAEYAKAGVFNFQFHSHLTSVKSIELEVAKYSAMNVVTIVYTYRQKKSSFVIMFLLVILLC